MESYEFSLTEAEKEVLDSYSQSINFTPGRIVEYIIKDLVVQWSDNAWRSGVAIAPEKIGRAHV